MLYDPKWENQITVSEPWRSVLLKAADLIRKHGLAKYTQMADDGSMCLHGAISVAMCGRPYAFEAGDCAASLAVARYLGAQGVPPELASKDGCAPWNNQPDRTAEEVIEALEGAAVAV